jgi:hypothetical protein
MQRRIPNEKLPAAIRVVNKGRVSSNPPPDTTTARGRAYSDKGQPGSQQPTVRNKLP